MKTGFDKKNLSGGAAIAAGLRIESELSNGIIPVMHPHLPISHSSLFAPVITYPYVNTKHVFHLLHPESLNITTIFRRKVPKVRSASGIVVNDILHVVPLPVYSLSDAYKQLVLYR